MVKSRSLRNRRKRKRKRKLILALMTLFFLVILGYSGYEYIAGKNQAIGKVSGDTSGQNSIEVPKSQYKEDFEGIDNKDGKTNILLLGVDQRGEEISRTDTIMVAQYNPSESTVKVASIMRDTYVNIPNHGHNKINAAFAIGGPELLRQTIVENFGIEIEYYSIIDFKGFTRIVDTLAPNGVQINVEKDMEYHSYDTDISLTKGPQKLDGEELLDYARFRHDAEGDFGRVERQQKVIKLLKNELASFNGMLKAPRLIGTLQPYIDTNIGSGKVLELGKDLLLNPVNTVETMSIPTADNVWNERKAYPVGLVLAHNKQKSREDLQQFLNEDQTGQTSQP